MAETFQVQRRIQWRDTDAAGIAHFTAMMQMMEEAEHALFRHLGLSVSQHEAGEHLSWPRVSVACQFKRPVRFEDSLTIDVRIIRVGEKSVSYEFDMKHEGNPVAVGTFTTVCCRVSGEGPPESVPIPPQARSQLQRMLD
jgi:4-hydroxybenzoyl-CoA thioesterase/acyl-CoA thioester hydrolase